MLLQNATPDPPPPGQQQQRDGQGQQQHLLAAQQPRLPATPHPPIRLPLTPHSPQFLASPVQFSQLTPHARGAAQLAKISLASPSIPALPTQPLTLTSSMVDVDDTLSHGGGVGGSGSVTPAMLNQVSGLVRSTSI